MFSPLQIWDAYNVKAQTFKTAIEAASMLLRIDQIFILQRIDGFLS